MRAFRKDTNGYFRVFYTDTGHVVAWVATRAEARKLCTVI